ncbi:hypothetical protein Tco_1110985 [Tanacetum coccineum]|uniref:Transmembrane protein n=1 Tax=Tanacetum coccineum TaxID=301880 RepID=A0ABQ5IMP0_9ASTR
MWYQSLGALDLGSQVEFHREIHDLNFRGSSCKNLFVLSSSNRGRLLGFTDLMRQKNKRMKQEGLIQHYGILEDLKSNSKKKIEFSVFGFIEDVITKTIDYHLFDVVVEFHREIHDLNFRGSSCKNLFVLSSSNRGRLLGFTDLMRQKNKRMKQEGLIQHYGILEDLKSNSSHVVFMLIQHGFDNSSSKGCCCEVWAVMLNIINTAFTWNIDTVKGFWNICSHMESKISAATWDDHTINGGTLVLLVYLVNAAKVNSWNVSTYNILLALGLQELTTASFVIILLVVIRDVNVARCSIMCGASARMHVYNKQQFLIEDEAAAGHHLWFMMIIGFLVSSSNLVTTTKRKDLVIPVLCQTKVSAARVKRSFVLMLLASKVFNAAYSSAATWDDHTINGGTLVLLVYLVNAAKILWWHGMEIDNLRGSSLQRKIVSFREIHDLNFRGSLCKNLIVLPSSNRERLLGFTDLMRQKNETRRTNSALWDSRRLEVKQ